MVSAAKILDGGLQMSADVTSIWPLAHNTIAIGISNPSRLAVWEGAARITEYALPCSPGAIGSAPTGAAILCNDPFGYVLVNDTKPLRFYRMKSGSYDGERITSDQVRGQWIGAVGQRLFASFRIPAAGKSANFEINDTSAFSPAGWKQRGCEKVHTGMGLWPTIIGVVVATRSTADSPEIAALSPDLGRIEKVVDPPLDTLGCGIMFGPSELICVLSSGSLVRPLDRRRPTGSVSSCQRQSGIANRHGHVSAVQEARSIFSSPGRLGMALGQNSMFSHQRHRCR